MYPVLKTESKCVICNGKIPPGRRYDTIYCSPRCKQRAYAARQKAKANAQRP